MSEALTAESTFFPPQDTERKENKLLNFGGLLASLTCTPQPTGHFLNPLIVLIPCFSFGAQTVLTFPEGPLLQIM